MKVLKINLLLENFSKKCKFNLKKIFHPNPSSSHVISIYFLLLQLNHVNFSLPSHFFQFVVGLFLGILWINGTCSRKFAVIYLSFNLKWLPCAQFSYSFFWSIRISIKIPNLNISWEMKITNCWMHEIFYGFIDFLSSETIKKKCLNSQIFRHTIYTTQFHI